MAESYILRASRHALEAQMTQAQAIAWAHGQREKSGRWPSRRFRVEKSRGGNSRLLGATAARNTQKKYGGKVVELIPAAKFCPKPMDDATDGAA